MLKDSILMSLTHINRFSQLNFIERDRDSDHTIRMQLYILELYNRFPDIVPVKELTYRALVHDLDEVVLCDIPRTVKYYNDESYALIEKISRQLLMESGITNSIIQEIETSKSKGDAWDDVMYFLDAYDAYSTLIKEYRIQQSKDLVEPTIAARNYIGDLYSRILEKKLLPEPIIEYLSQEMNEVVNECNSVLGKQGI